MKTFKEFINEETNNLDSKVIYDVIFYVNGKSPMPDSSVFNKIPENLKKSDSKFIYKKIVLTDAKFKKLMSGSDVVLKSREYSSWSTSLKSAQDFKSKTNGNQIVVKKTLNHKNIAVNVNDFFEFAKEVHFYKSEMELIMKNDNYLLTIKKEEIV